MEQTRLNNTFQQRRKCFWDLSNCQRLITAGYKTRQISLVFIVGIGCYNYFKQNTDNIIQSNLVKLWLNCRDTFVENSIHKKRKKHQCFSQKTDLPSFSFFWFLPIRHAFSDFLKITSLLTCTKLRHLTPSPCKSKPNMCFDLCHLQVTYGLSNQKVHLMPCFSSWCQVFL